MQLQDLIRQGLKLAILQFSFMVVNIFLNNIFFIKNVYFINTKYHF